jgi:ABC-type phosphate transport system auxiliary subunit
MVGPRTLWTNLKDRAKQSVRRKVQPHVGPVLQTLQSLCDQMVLVRRQQDELQTAVARMATLDERQTDLTEQVQATQAIGWDHAALARRLAVLEDRIEALTAELDRRNAAEPRGPMSRAG